MKRKKTKLIITYSLIGLAFVAIIFTFGVVWQITYTADFLFDVENDLNTESSRIKLDLSQGMGENGIDHAHVWVTASEFEDGIRKQILVRLFKDDELVKQVEILLTADQIRWIQIKCPKHGDDIIDIYGNSELLNKVYLNLNAGNDFVFARGTTKCTIYTKNYFSQSDFDYIQTGDGNDRIYVNHHPNSGEACVNRVGGGYINTGGGNDTIKCYETTGNVTIVGGPGRDRIIGTPGDDILIGDLDDIEIDGVGGNDIIVEQ